uniref:Uncharacterized protein n=2 Tax=Haptolina brevifila TaxID=156173 RepID=A0A7S2HPW5_9EUKA|mmetsp:Transcript_56718/g.112620  ORF Transcript_56718/g.112620 Transcript_56718/m.112620 type:complete len:161 (+) Transcript_56718:98-580(+)
MNACLILAAALLPPISDSLERWRDERMHAAGDAARARNLNIERQPDADHVVSLKLDGIETSYYFTYWPAEKRAKILLEYMDMVSVMADTEAMLSRRHFPLLSPAGKFWVALGCRVAFITLLTLYLPTPDTTAATALLMVWAAQLVAVELFGFFDVTSPGP